jgi:membrane-associated protein
MGERIFDLLRIHFQHHGYFTLAGALLLENAGIPVPGETILLFASFLAFSERQLHLPWIIVIGTVACTLGDNIGYAIGHRGGRPLLERWKNLFRVKQSHLERGERLFARFGPVAVFLARFVFGMRIIAGPLAGVLRMPWRKFVLFNFLGAVSWVTIISLVGFLFGQNWSTLVRGVKGIELAVLVLAAAGFLIWRHWNAKSSDTGSSEDAG